VFTTAAVVTGLVTLSKQKDYRNVPSDAEAENIASTGRTYRTLTDIEVGAALLSAGATAYFYFTAPNAKTTQSASRALMRVAPSVGPNAAAVAVFGNF